MPTCQVCGLWIDDEQEICSECGSRQRTSAATPSESTIGPLKASKFPMPGAWGCGCLTVVLVLFALLNLPKVRGAKEAARRSQCKNNLKEIGLALRLYHSEYGSFPPAFVVDAAGRPMHSWRVLILPFIDEKCRALHATYDFSEPWDSARNKKLLDNRPSIFRCPSGETGHRHDTLYVAIFGPNCVFRGTEPVSLDEITDASHETLLIAEVTEADIPWIKPDDIDVTRHPKPGDRLGISSDHAGGFQALFVDGSVRFVNKTIEQATFDALVTRNGDESVGDF
jgi:prepilin-type processing-associated H-X9-DG protein